MGLDRKQVGMSKSVAAYEKLGRKSQPLEGRERTIAQHAGRTRSNLGAKTAVNFRFSTGQWKAMRILAINENVSLQGLVIVALDRLFASRGMPFSDLKDEGP